MSDKDQINYLRIALLLQGFAVNDRVCDLILRTYQDVIKKGGSFSLKDAAIIQEQIDKDYEENE